MKKWLIIFLVLALVIGAAIYFVYNKPHKDIAASEADFTVSAPALFQEFETNENEANKKYLDKVISVKGHVELIETTPEGLVNVGLATGSPMSTIRCAMLPEENENAKKLAEGAEVTIKGLCTGYLMDVVLTKCSITEGR